MISTSDRKVAVKLINEARVAGARLKPACKVLSIDKRTYQRWTKANEVKEDQRPIAKRTAPKNKLSDDERAQITKAPNKVWTWDITWLHGPIKGQYFKLYLIVDIYSRKIIAYEVWKTEKALYAEYLIKKAVLTEGIAGQPLILHSDNGSSMKAATFLATLEKLGVQSSFSRPRVSNDNPYSEALFRTLKYLPKYPSNGFSSLSEARKWVQKFVHWYNHGHLHSGIKFLTPHQRHSELDVDILKKRIAIYEEAKRRNPERWSKSVRNWSLPEFVALNPVSDEEFKEMTN